MCSALQLRGNAEAKELPFISAFLFSLGEEGVLLTKRRPFLSPKPSPTPLHVRGGDIALLTQSVASFVNFDGVKFINLSSNLNANR